MLKYFSVVPFIFIYMCLLVGCTDNPASKIQGAWKSVEESKSSRKPETLIFKEQSMITPGNDPIEVKYSNVDGAIFVRRNDSADPIFKVFLTSSPKQIEIESLELFGKKNFIKTSIEDLETIRNTPQKSTTVPDDPF